MNQVMTLQEFITKKGIKEVERLLEVNKSAVYDWKSLVVPPTFANACKLIKISRGKLTFDSIYMPFYNRKK